MENNLQLLPINHLLQYSFFVPSYQRGYRWTEVEVSALLKDLFVFMNKDRSREDFYCLQPIVVTESKKRDKSWDLIDGQQRLTTIFLILKYLNERTVEEERISLFNLEFETRSETSSYLLSIDETKKQQNIDFFHIYNAFRCIKDFFLEKKNWRADFESILLNRTYIIWFQTQAGDEIEVFTRINVGKIPLTNGELIRALFLKAENFKDTPELKQIQISTEWDEMERKLRNPRFWYFLNSSRDKSQYDNHIDFIFNLISSDNKKGEVDKLHSFLHYYKFLGEKVQDLNRIVDEKWLEVKTHFHKLDEWYQDKELYHYIGFLIEHKEINIEEAIRTSNIMDKDEFADWIARRIKTSLSGINLHDLSYHSHKPQIKKILLLFNIETLLQTEKATFWFPFDKYKLEKWDIEHVNAQTRMIPDSKNYIGWLSDLLEYFTGYSQYSDLKMPGNEKTYRAAIDQIIANLGKDEKTLQQKILVEKVLLNLEQSYVAANLEDLFENLFSFFKEGELGDNDGIENLALLDGATNRSYKNAMFPIKRKRIIENDKNGIFVPIATKNIFLKYYSRQMGQALYWTKEDADEYGNAIKNLLSKYLD